METIVLHCWFSCAFIHWSPRIACFWQIISNLKTISIFFPSHFIVLSSLERRFISSYLSVYLIECMSLFAISKMIQTRNEMFICRSDPVRFYFVIPNNVTDQCFSNRLAELTIVEALRMRNPNKPASTPRLSESRSFNAWAIFSRDIPASIWGVIESNAGWYKTIWAFLWIIIIAALQCRYVPDKLRFEWASFEAGKSIIPIC